MAMGRIVDLKIRAQTVEADRFASRSQRFAARMAGEPLPCFGALAELPQWMLANLDRAQLSRVTALLHLRPLLDREIGGAKLSALASEVGDACFDAICTASLDASLSTVREVSSLPRPDQLEDIGDGILARSAPGPQQEKQFLVLADEAVRIVAQETAS